MHALQRALRSENRLFGPPAVGVEDYVVHLVPLAVDLVVVVDGLHPRDAAVGVMVESVLEFRLLGGELLDDLLRRGDGRSEVHAPEAGIERHGSERVLFLRRRRNCAARP